MRARLFLIVAALGTAACSPGLRPLPLPPRTAPTDQDPIAAEPSTTVEAPEGAVAADLDYLTRRQLMVPVAGIEPRKIPDSFNEPRDGGGRVHRAVDILAPRGTPVLAADAGVIFKMKSNTLGGITIYALDASHRFVYYYAHLDHYRDDLYEGAPLAQGDVIGYVGTTGNAPKDTPHLHFQIMRMRTDGKYWDGEPVDPRPFLVRSGRLVARNATNVEGARSAQK